MELVRATSIPAVVTECVGGTRVPEATLGGIARCPARKSTPPRWGSERGLSERWRRVGDAGEDSQAPAAKADDKADEPAKEAPKAGRRGKSGGFGLGFGLGGGSKDKVRGATRQPYSLHLSCDHGLLPPGGSTGLAGTRPAGLPHPWGATSCTRKAAPVTKLTHADVASRVSDPDAARVA